MSKIEFGGHTQYNNGGYSVIVSKDGSIEVQAGDWLSKYSMAIYGDFDHIDSFVRKENGIVKEIINKDLIHVGETLWHRDTLGTDPPEDGTTPSPVNPPGPNPPNSGDITPEELRRRVKDILNYLGRVACPMTDWELKGSAGGSIGIDTEGLKIGIVGSYLDFTVARDSDSSPTNLRGLSIGGSFGVDFDFGPVSVTLAPPTFKSTGFIVKFPGAGATISRDELSGAFIAFEIGASLLVGGSAMLIVFGIQLSDLFTLDYTGPARFFLPAKGAICTAGWKVAAPELAVSLHGGYLVDWS